MSMEDWITIRGRPISKDEKKCRFPLLWDRRVGIGVDPVSYSVTCVKLIQTASIYSNEIQTRENGQVESIKYMMSRSTVDHRAFQNSIHFNIPVRVLLCDGPSDYDCGWWSIAELHLDDNAGARNHAILRFSRASDTRAPPPSSPTPIWKSELEKRWSLFFDALGIQWKYEPETFTLMLGKTYTPDFYLPDLKLYLEIKPMTPCVATMQKCAVLSAQNKKIAILSGPPLAPFVPVNAWDDVHSRYREDTSKRYTAMVFEKGSVVAARAYFMEPVLPSGERGQLGLYPMTEENCVYGRWWDTPALARAYERTDPSCKKHINRGSIS